MNLHDAGKPRPQVYSFTSIDGQNDTYVTSGDVEVLYVNWEKLDSDFFSDYTAEDFLSDWRELGRIADPKVRKAERRDYLTAYHERATSARRDRIWKQQYDRRRLTEQLEAARLLLRATGELPPEEAR